MRYSKKFKPLIESGGLTYMSGDSRKKLMNIISLEGTINGLLIAQNLLKETQPNVFGLKLFEKQRELTKLTGNFPPEKLIEFLVKDKVF